MKQQLLLLSLLFTQTVYAATITSTATGGQWNNPATWIGGIVPGSNDVVIIVATATVTVQNMTIGNPTAIKLDIVINGTLSLVTTNFLITGFNLTNPSTITIAAGGKITSSSNNFLGDLNFISIGGFPVEYIPAINGPVINGPAVINNGGVLPIELISFTATISGESIHITWATATELNNDYFTIERSLDGLNWTKIGEISGAGNSTSRIDYEFFDTNPIPGIVYYRLMQTDFDGQFEYFKPTVVVFEPGNFFKVYPNPSIGPVAITTSSELTKASIYIYDVYGKSLSVPFRKNRYQAFLDFSDINSGVYLLEIVYPQSRLTHRIIKQ